LEVKALPGALSQWAEYAATAIELLAIVIIASYIFLGTASYLFSRLKRPTFDPAAFKLYRRHLSRSLLLGLEILVAADIVRTVTLERSLASIAALGLLILVRTFLSWSVEVEMEGCWPWQARTDGTGAR
jgi:uncharacterized membrane protein